LLERDESAERFLVGDSLTLTIVQQLATQPDSLAAYLVTGPVGTAQTTVQVYDLRQVPIGTLQLRRVGPP
jgi:hypothetical protein